MSAENRMATRLAAAVRRPALPTNVEATGNKRWAKRKPSSTPAKILFDGLTTPFDCLVKDISSTGAQIEMVRSKYNPDASPSALPNDFTLIIPLDRTAVECRSMWRRGSRLGVRFMGMVRTLQPARPPMMAKTDGKKQVR